LASTTGWLDGPRAAGWILRWLVLFALPPAAATLLAARIARPALDRLSADDWVGVETLETAPWAAVLRLVAAVLAASAAVLLYDAYVSLGLSALLVSWTVQLIADGVSERQYGKVIDLWNTELAVNVRASALMLGIGVKGVGTIASATRRAEVYKTSKVILTPPLIEHFSRSAVDALVAQGLARAASLAGSPVAGVVMVVSALLAVANVHAVIRYGDELPAGADWVPFTAAAGLALFALPFRMITRAANRAADGRAAALTDPEALVAALAEQERRRGEPPNRSRFEDVFLHRAYVARRAAALGRRYGWGGDDVARLLATTVGADPSRYAVPLPPVPEPPTRRPFAAAALVSMVALPLAFAHAAELSPPGVLRAVVLAAGVLGVPFLYGAVLWFVNRRRNSAGERELCDRLRADSIDPAALSGLLVAFAPDREAHNYNGTPQWDLGYLVPAGDRLLFIGRRVRVAVPWVAVEVSLTTGAMSWRPSRVVLTWDGGAFSVWPVGRSVPRGRAGMVAELQTRLQAWRDGAVASDSLPAAWADLPPPPPTPDGAKTIRESMNVRGPVQSIVILAVLIVVAAWLTGLPVVAEWRGAAYAVTVVVVTVFAYTLPTYLFSRRKQSPTE
jgi:hypothetical protein